VREDSAFDMLERLRAALEQLRVPDTGSSQRLSPAAHERAVTEYRRWWDEQRARQNDPVASLDDAAKYLGFYIERVLKAPEPDAEQAVEWLESAQLRLEDAIYALEGRYGAPA
jgi:hypothetical protein